MHNVFICEVKSKMFKLWSKSWFGKCKCWCKRRSTKYCHKNRWGIFVVTFQYF